MLYDLCLQNPDTRRTARQMISTVPETPVILTHPSQHTMADSLREYVSTRTHELVDELLYERIHVLGLYDRRKAASRKEKRDKPENWQRPTAELLAGGELRIYCFPGQAHVFHYASLIATYLALTDRDPTKVYFTLPADHECETAIHEAGYSAITPTEVVIVASGISHLVSLDNFRDFGAFQAKQETLGARSVTWLIVKHSFWGDIAHRLGAELAKRGFQTVLFIGKLGSLDPRHVPNETLATGNQSTINGQTFQWVNLFSELEDMNVIEGAHITLPSVLQETVAWRASNIRKYAFVDPEIGNLATGVLSNGARFSYLHIVSDNLSRRFSEDLSNERSGNVRQKRAKLYQMIKQLLRERLQK